jgi:hypothetical protein
MSISSIGTSRRNLVKALGLSALLAGGLLAAPHASGARHQGPFAEFAGNWRGGGRVVTTDGRAEMINCRARNDISQGGASISEALVCASDAARFDVRFTAVADGGNVTGNWQESTRNVGGTLQGQIVDGAFAGTVSGGGLTLQVSYRTNGRALAVEIGINAGGIDKVEVSMRHGG